MHRRVRVGGPRGGRRRGRRGGGGGDDDDRVWFPVELGKRARTNILRTVKEDAFVYELGESFQLM